MRMISMVRLIRATSTLLTDRAYMQIMATTLVRNWIYRRMDMPVRRIPTPVCLTASLRKPLSGGMFTDQMSRYILFKGQTRGSH